MADERSQQQLVICIMLRLGQNPFPLSATKSTMIRMTVVS